MQSLSLPKITLILSCIFIILIFLFSPHFIELSTLETWFFYKGLIWYKEFPAEHFPLGRLILLPIHLLFNWSFRPDPFVSLFCGLFSLGLIYRFGKKYFSIIGISISLFFFTIFFWYFTTGVSFFHEILIASLLLWSIYLLFDISMSKTISLKKLLSLGILLSSAELSGQIATLTIAVFTFLLIYLIKVKSRNSQMLVSSGSTLFAGLLLPLLPLLIYFISNNALSDFFYWNVTYYLTYATDASKNLLSLPYKIILPFYLPLIGLFLLMFAKKNRNFKNISIFLLSLSTIPGTIFSIFHFHHFNYALPILSLNAGIIFSKTLGNELLKRILNIVTILALLFVFFGIILPWHLSRLIFPPSLKIYNLETTPGDNTHETIEWLKKNTSPNSRIMVAGTPIVYFASDRLPASRPAKGIPYTWTPLQKVREEMVSKPPQYWIVDQRFLTRIAKDNGRIDIQDFVEGLISNCHKKVAQFDNWEIWQRTCY